jgi:spore germination protein
MNKSLTNRQCGFIVYSAIVGYGIIDMPKNVAEAGGTSGWISILIVAVVASMATYIITYLSYNNENQIVYQYSEKLVGKFITFIFKIVYTTYFLLIFSYLIRMYAETLKLIMLNKTPIWAIEILFYIVVFYAISKGPNVIARVCEIYLPMAITGMLVMSFILFTQGSVINLRPFFVEQGVMSYLKSSFQLIFPFLGMELLLFMPINKKNNKGLYKYTLYTILFIGVFYIFVVESAISVVGAETAAIYKASLFNIIRGVDVHYLEFFRRLDGIYMLMWTMDLFCGICLWGYSLTVSLGSIFKGAKHNSLVTVIIIISITISLIPKSKSLVEKLINYASYVGIVAAFFIPTILFIVMKVRRHDKKI